MRLFIIRALKMLLAVIFPGALFAQGNPDYTVLLNAGKFVPRENGRTVTRDSEEFRNSLFRSKHYVTIQFRALPDKGVREQLQASGVELFDYIPNKAYTAAVQENFSLPRFRTLPIRSVFQLSPEQKTVPALLNGKFPEHAVRQPGFVDVTVITYEKFTREQVAKELQGVGATILEEMPMFRTFTVRAEQKKIKQLVSLPFVQWVEPIDPPNVQENLLGRSLHRVTVLNEGVRNLKGDGINVGIWDGGEVSPHLDFTPVASRLSIMETGSVSDHATHVAGTIGGRGLINPKARGMAPNATLYSYNFNGNIATEMFNAIPALGLNVSSHSYGGTATCGLTGSAVAYSTTSRNTDVNLNTFPTHLHVHSAGNSQTSCSGGWSTITGSGKTAKNNILVANITSTEAISGSSSFGPVADGRVKPEISALGTNVLSTYSPLNTYATISGTSMATPGVSGTVALLVQRYKQLNNNTPPISSLIKAVVCNNAADLGNPGPDYKFGFGRINALGAVKALEENRYVVNTIATGDTNDITITVPAGAVRLRVMLTWNDPAGTANANPALINNLDLSVHSGSSVTLPWILNPASPASNATRGIDNVSNIEQVTINSPASGTYTLRVSGTAIASGPTQQYSLTWSVDEPYIEVIFPNGGESFTPGVQEAITWDNAGITTNQTVQYSINNGATWVTLSSSVAPGTTRYNWTVPAGLNTSTALVRVFSGTISDQSDTTFKILGIPSGLNAVAGTCPGSLNFTWTATANATNYDLLNLDMSTGQWTVLASNLTGTSYTASGLVPNASMWFSIVAKNTTTGAVSERANAINRTVPSTGSGAQLGAITGPTFICGGSQSVTYTVPAQAGVTTYNWSVPAGATIVSGQGSNSVVVSYTTTSSSGSVTVYGTGGACPTAASTLAVSVNNSIPAPTSGGDQTVCTTGSTTVLTAIATVPPGYTVVWYSAATGGTVVANPTLSAAGTVTYYAAAKVNNSSCESDTRTAVTLTLKTSVPATISASGPTTFCPGNSVTLTASPGTSYSWSNGATTQSITVSASGSYSVTVTQANGCANTSPATVVTVNTVQDAIITTSGTTTICEGESLVLTANAGSSYTWSNGATSQSITIKDPGTYTVTVFHPNGCSSTSTAVSVIVNPAPVASVSANGPTTFCQGGSVTLTASTADSYLWSNGATSRSITVSTAGAYSVTTKSSSGCSSTSPATTVTVSPAPTVSISAAPYTKLAPGLSTTLSAEAAPAGAIAYQWLKNGSAIPGATAATLPVTVDELGEYTVTATTADGCSRTSAAVVIADSTTTQFYIFPNPTKGKIQLSYNNPSGSKITYSIAVYDARGALVRLQQNSITTAYEKMEVDLSGHSQGIYLVVLSDSKGKKIASGRVVVLPE